MSRGYRCIILAAFGWLILAALPSQGVQREEQANSAESIANSLQSISRSLEKTNKTSEYNPSCTPGQDNRRSDLCAQWKAADSAYEAATWTRRAYWLVLLGTVIGAATLGAAVAAAKYARDAAAHTEAGSREAKRAADAAEAGLSHARHVAETQLRAYIVSTKEAFTLKEEESAEYIFTFEFKNSGQTPAHDLKISVDAYWIPMKVSKTNRFHRFFDRTFAMGTVGPQIPVFYDFPIPLGKRRLSHMQGLRGSVKATVMIEYLDSFECPWRYTQELVMHRQSLFSNIAYTNRCHNERYQLENKEQGQANRELPLDGGGEPDT